MAHFPFEVQVDERTVRVVLADDHPVVRSGIAGELRSLPNISIAAEVGDGPALFATLAQLRPDLLLIDLTMPEFEPISAVRRIRTLYPDLKILVITAYDDDAYIDGVLGAGVHGYHLKDQPLDDLRLAVQRVMAGERWVSSALIDKLVRYRVVSGRLTPLTPRQNDLMGYLREGLDNQTIARRMGLSVKTVENHLTNLYRLLGVQSRLQAVRSTSEDGARGHLRPEATPDVVAAAAPTPGKPTALLVDDNARYRAQLRRSIARVCPGMQVCEAENTEEALVLAKGFAPHLALVDVVLGDENGIDCARRIKECSPATRVLLISAYPDPGFRRRGREVGAEAFVDKQYLNAAALRDILDDVVR